MRPYQNGKTPKTPGTAGKRQPTKKRGQMNGVRNTLVKAKVTAVKARQRLRGAEEVVDLLEQSINGAATVATPNKKEAPKNEKKMQDKFKKSIANLKGLEQEIKKRTTRSSTKQGQQPEDQVDGRVTYNGNGIHIEVGKEATEVAASSSSGPGFLKRAVSKLWKVPIEGLSGVPYSDINSPPATPTPPPRNPHNGAAAAAGVSPPAEETSAKTCIIS